MIVFINDPAWITDLDNIPPLRGMAHSQPVSNRFPSE